MSDRFSARARAARRRRLVRWAVLAAVVGVALLAGWLVWFSSALDARHVVVRGESSLTAAQVRQAADVPTGAPLARLDAAAAEKRVRVQLKPVKSVRVTRRWPHTVVVTVTERTAVAWVQIGAQQWAVDSDGVAFRAVSHPSVPELTVDTLDRDSLRAAARVALAVTRGNPELARATTSISASTADSVTLSLTNGRTVVWGSADRADDKLRVLKALLKISARTYNVSAPDDPTTAQ